MSMRLPFVLGLLSVASLGRAQTPDTTRTPIGAWASLSLGAGSASNRHGTLLGLQFGGYASYGHWMAGYRRGGASTLEDGGAYDDALLVGWRVTDMYTTGFVTVGPAKVYDESTGLGNFGLGFNATAGVNIRAIGFGASLFGAVARRSYIGVGLTADLGWIR